MKFDTELLCKISAGVAVLWPVIALVGGLGYFVAKDKIDDIKSKYNAKTR